eukprot:1039420-Rhodomonas_salina.2
MHAYLGANTRVSWYKALTCGTSLRAPCSNDARVVYAARRSCLRKLVLMRAYGATTGKRHQVQAYYHAHASFDGTTPLSAYAGGTKFPVLTERMALPGFPCRHCWLCARTASVPSRRVSSYAIVLRDPYAVSGTDAACANRIRRARYGRLKLDVDVLSAQIAATAPRV